MNVRSQQSAFSLVELSIVLVILGLLVGGVLAGQSLIRAAELRSVSTSFSNYSTAVYTFRDKYIALPGDMANATQFWGAADGNDGTGGDCTIDTASVTVTCNGNGDGILSGGATTGAEGLRVWQHLSNAQLIEGQYTGARNQPHVTAFDSFTLGLNVPAVKYRRTGLVMMNRTTPIYGRIGHAFQYGGVNHPSLGNLWERTIDVQDLYSLDAKIDDSKGDQGFVRGDSGCMDAPDTGPSGNYLLNGTNKCQAWMFLNF